jgi:HAD superfamily hydrolase (TIGR01490 family)
LLTVNSGALWMKRERRLGRISFWQLLQGTFYLMAYKFRALDMERLTVKALKTVKGLEEEVVRQWTREWFFEEVVPHCAPGAQAVLDEHRSRGHRLVLLTTSSTYESEVAAKHFELDAFLCTRYEVKDGLFTGDVVRPVCYGEGKVTLAQRYAAEHDVDLDESYFYTDSFSDLPMLRRVNHPRVVHPDPRLRRHAMKCNWPILDWTS